MQNIPVSCNILTLFCDYMGERPLAAMKGEDFMEDEKIVLLYWNRNENAIAETAKKYGKYCYTVAYNVLHSSEDSDECVNDAWNVAWNTIPPEKPTALRCFLARITRNIAIDRYRHVTAQKRSAEVQNAIDEYWECIPDKDAPIEDQLVLRETINGFLSTLDKRTRVIFMRRYWYSMSAKEIAKSMNLSQKHVNVILHRTRNKFKDYLTQKGVSV